jgi:hypothetical protein
MADSFVQVAPDSTGKMVDTVSMTVGANTVQRQRVSIGDGVNDNTSTIKAASTAAVATDTSLVVAINPNTPISILGLASASTSAGQTGVIEMGWCTTANPTYVTAQSYPISLTTAGAKRSDITSFGGTVVTLGSKVSASSMPVVIASDQAVIASNITQMSGSSLSLGSKTSTSSVPVVIASDQAAVKTFSMPNGGSLLGYFSVQVTTAVTVKGAAGQIYGYHLYNTTAAVAYVQVFNTLVGSVTLGTTPPVISIPLPASSGATIEIGNGLYFSTAIVVAATTTRTGAVTAAVDCVIYYV